MKKLEDKILDEIRRRVIEQDRFLKEKKEFQEMQEATIEALAEMTSLTETEIDKISQEVHNEINEKHAKQEKNKYYLLFALMGLLIVVFFRFVKFSYANLFIIIAWSGVLFYLIKKFISETSKRNIVIDYFDNKNYRWSTNSILKQHRKIENGKYVFQGGTSDWCYWDSFDIDLPEHYIIECECKWLKGIYDEFGVTLLDADGNYINLEANGKAEGSYSVKYDGKWVKNESFRGTYSSEKLLKQFIEVKGDKFSYKLQGKLIYEEKTEKLGKITAVGFRVCDKQTVEFHKLKIIDVKTGETLFFDDFSEQKDVWEPKHEFYCLREIKDDKYYVTVNREEWCYWSNINIDFSGDCDFVLKARWISGEANDFGLVIFESNANDYYFFHLNSNGEASIAF